MRIDFKEEHAENWWLYAEISIELQAGSTDFTGITGEDFPAVQ